MINPGEQHRKRMREIAISLSDVSAEIQDSFREMRKLESRAGELKTAIEQLQSSKASLLKLQAELLETPTVTPSGLPPGISDGDFQAITGKTFG